MSKETSEKKLGKILFVDYSSSVRQQFRDVVKQFGYQDFHGVPSIQDALSVLEVETAEWVIFPLSPQERVNGLNFLETCINHAANLRNIRTTLLLDETEYYALLPAFELGLMSYLDRRFNADSLFQSLSDFFTLGAKLNWDFPLISAQYLIPLLMKSQQFSSLISLAKSLLQLYPGNVDLLLKMAQAFKQMKQEEDCYLTLQQAKSSDPSKEKIVDELMIEFFGNADFALKTEKKPDSAVNALGLEHCVIVDPDVSIHKMMTDILRSFGVEKISCFTDGEEAVKELKDKSEPSLIIQEWKIPGITGPIFIQRLRQIGFMIVPIIVISSLLKEEDWPLLREMDVTEVFPKPLDKKMIIKKLINVIQHQRHPSDFKTIKIKTHMLLNARRMDEARESMQKLKATKSPPPGSIELLEAEFAYIETRYEQAKIFAIDSLKFNGDSLFVLNLLGKILMKSQDFESALLCFKKAQSLAPLNIERICSMAEVNAELGNREASQQNLESAKKLDATNEKIKEKEAEIAISQGNSKKALKLLEQMSSVENIIAFMNNRAIAFALNNMIEEGLQLYDRALASLPKNKQHLQPIIYYNQALANIRANRYEEAMKSLEKIKAKEGSTLMLKTHSLSKRLFLAIQHGTPLVLRKGETEKNSMKPQMTNLQKKNTSYTDKMMIETILVKRGDACCYLLYKNEEKYDTQVESMLSYKPRFTPRKIIKREETLGVDTTIKRSS